jgi:hypothetical protein
MDLKKQAGIQAIPAMGMIGALDSTGKIFKWSFEFLHPSLGGITMLQGHTDR